MGEITTIELLPDSKKIRKGIKTIDSGDSWVEVIEIVSVENKKGHTFVECKVKFLEE